MTGKWAGSRRRPWSERKAQKPITIRDNWSCQVPTGPGVICGAYAPEVDHIDRQGSRTDPANMRAICTFHHRKKTQQEALEARTRFSAKRVGEKHPGVLD